MSWEKRFNSVANLLPALAIVISRDWRLESLLLKAELISPRRLLSEVFHHFTMEPTDKWSTHFFGQFGRVLREVHDLA